MLRAEVKSHAIFRHDVEGLRAIAVLAVMAFHYGLPVQGGFVGVDIFFVISGYLITSLLVSELDASASIDLVRFYGRRARRLLPAALLMTAVTLWCAFFILSPPEQKLIAKSAVSSSLYISNFWFQHQTLDYFAPEIEQNPFLHTWTLSVEEQFYLMWPALLLFAVRFFKREHLLPVLCTTTLASFLLCLWLTYTNEPVAFYASPARAWEFGIGGIAALNRIRFNPLIGLFALIILMLSPFVINPSMYFPGFVALAPVVATMVIISSERPSFLLQTKPLQWLGRNSYSIYLWHWPIIVLARVLYPDQPFYVVAICALLTFAIADISFRVLEHPIRSSRWLTSKRYRSIGMGAALTSVGALIATGAFITARFYANDPAQRLIAEASSAKSASAKLSGCIAFLTDKTPRSCSLGDVNSKTIIVLFGDSHADQWSTIIDRIGKKNGWKVVTYLKASCSPFEIPVYSARLRRNFYECQEWRSAVTAQIINLHPSLVIFGEFNAGYVYRKNPLDGLISHAAWKRGFEKSLSKFKEHNIQILLIRDNPTPSVNVTKCLSRSLWLGNTTSRCSTKRSIAIDDVYGRLATSAPNVLNMTDIFCTNTDCHPIIKGAVVYKDTNHVSNIFTMRLEYRFLESIKNAMNRKPRTVSSAGPSL